MTLKEQIAADEGIFFNVDDFAETIVYNGQEILAIETMAAEDRSGTPGFVVPVYTVLVSVADVTNPKAGDSVTFRSKTYRVGENPISDGGMWAVDLIKKTIQV